MKCDPRYAARFRWLTPAALIFIAVVFGNRYARIPYFLALRALTTLPLPPWLKQAVTSPFSLPLLGDYVFGLALFTSVPIYLSLSVAGIVLGVAALVFTRPCRSGRLALLLALASILALPLVSPYRPAVTVDPAQTSIHVPTQPGPYIGVVKQTQAGLEVRRCDYKLLGWDERDTLYGEEICGERHRYWVYHPISKTSLETVVTVPPDLFGHEVDREHLRTLGVGSSIPKDEALRIVVREPGLSSRRGGWTAFVARHLYGPEDVVVLQGGTHTP